MAGVLRGRVVWLIGLACCWLGFAADSLAQVPGMRREYPPDGYYLARRMFDEGEFVDAAKAFRSVLGSGLRTSESRWVDSICYYAMLGECFYQMGDLVQALEQFTAAENLFLVYPNWLLQVDFPPTIETAPLQMSRPINWGASGRRAMIGRFGNSYPVFQGRMDNEDVIRRGGVIALPEYMLLNVPEVVRCTALSIRRRREILGVTSALDPLNNTLATTLARRTPLNNWWQGWSDLLAGVTYSAVGNRAQAIGELQKAISLGGQYDHPLTATALIELGRLAFEEQQYDGALASFMEATYSAAWYSQFSELEEAFRLATATFLMSGAKAMYPPLEPARAWAHRNSTLLGASLLASAAQNAAEIGNGAAALGLAKEAHDVALRTSMLAGSLGARLNYVGALANFQGNNVAAGDAALAQLMAYQQRASRRLFEIGLVDSLAMSGTDAMSERTANELYAGLLREPTAKDWVLDPVETLTMVLSPPFGPLENWFELAWNRKDTERAFEIAEMIRRRRFFSKLPLGGRLLALQAVLESPPEALTQAGKLQQQELLARYPAYADLRRRSMEISRALKGIPVVPEEEAAARTQAQLFADWGLVSNQQEMLIRDMALRRLPSDFLFPPTRPFKDLQASLPDDLLVLTFLVTSRGVYGMGCSQKLQSQWRIEEPPLIRRDLVELLRQMGLFDRNQAVDDKQLADSGWKKTAARLLAPLTNNAKAGVWDGYRELVIIPDGILWYVPFESLQVAVEETTVPLISKIRMRYVPMLGFVPPDPQGVDTSLDMEVLPGQLFQHDEEWIAQTVDKIKKGSERVSVLPKVLPIPSSLFAARCNRLVVLADIDPSGRGPYDWSPLPAENEKLRGSLGAWLGLPWEGPQQLVLPGFHTSAENALRKGGSGDEIFLSVCALMASGTRTALISRWRTGGQTSHDLAREFAQELPYCSAAEAWQRSVQLVMGQEINLDREPRVKASGLEVDIKADHPFFWSGYMLVDTGGRPKDEMPAKPSEETTPAKPTEKAKPDEKAKPTESPKMAEDPAMARPAAAPDAKDGLPGTPPEDPDAATESERGTAKTKRPTARRGGENGKEPEKNGM